MNMNKKIKNAPLKEALLEVILSPDKTEALDYSLLVNELYQKLIKAYPTLIPLPGATFPFGFPDPIVRHRFTDSKNTKLVNIGEQVISINSIKYIGFTEFKDDIKYVLKEYLSSFKQYQIKRIGLRYINVIDTNGQKEERIFRNFAPNPLTKKTSASEFVNIYKYEEANAMNYRQSLNVIGDKQASLDLDYYKVFNQQLTTKEILDWVENAHSVIEDAFLNSFVEGYLK